MNKLKLFFVLFLLSCTVGPDYQKKDVYEDSQIAESLKLTGKDLKIDSSWYREFNDQNLNQLIAESLNSSPDVLGGLEKLRQARTMYKIDRTTYLPMFSIAAGYDYLKPSKNIGLAADTDYFKMGFDASWELDIWGKGRRLNEQRKAEFESSYFSLQNIKNVVTSEVASTYFALKTAEEQKRIALNNLKLQQDIFQTVKDKYLAGLADEAAYQQSGYVVETTKALIPALETEIKNYQNVLSVLSGNLPSSLKLDASKNPIKKAYQYDLRKLFDLPADIIRTRPDVKAAEKAMVAQNAAIGQAVASVYPNVSLSALLGLQSSTSSKLFNSSSKAHSFNPSSVLPVFEWERLQNQIDLEREKLAENYQNYRKTLLTAVQELSDAVTALEKEYEKNKATRNGVYKMRQALKAMREKYENGLIEFSDLLKTEQDLLSVETNLAQSNGAIYQNIIAFYKATGGGYNGI